MSGLLQRAGGRKFIATMAAIASSTGLVAFGCIEPGIYSVVMVSTVGAFIAGNVTQKALTGEKQS